MAKRQEPKLDRMLGGKLCRIIATGSENFAALVEFEDGSKKIVRRRALRKVRTSAKN